MLIGVGSRRRSASQAIDLPSGGRVNLGRLFTLKAKFAASQPSDLKVKAIDSLRQVSGLLDAKAPSDAAAFKAWLRQISQITAEAASEGGGLFGIGGVQVSDAEKATLTEISNALGT